MDDSETSPLSQPADEQQATSSDAGLDEEEATILTSPSAIKAEQFPSGLTPRELSLALEGELLDHFQLQDFIGGGGMGAVFKAQDTTLDRTVAVKVLASHSISDEDLQRRFQVEAHSTARLDHPNIARIHYVGRDRGLSYIVFEYIDGVNVRDLVSRNEPLNIGNALSFTYQIAHALAHAWQREVVHRDIKPSNILITREGQAKLVDMGLARLRQEDPTAQELTTSGVTLGTFDYISPEQARDPRNADTRSDIYSLGCSLFFMLTGRAPFAKGTAVQKLLQHQGDQPPKLSGLRSDVPESVDALIQRMLAKLPDDRPQTPAALVGELAQRLNELGLPLPHALAPLPTSPLVSRKSTWRHHIPWLAPLATMLALIAASELRQDKPEPNAFPPLRTPDTNLPAPSSPNQTEEGAIKVR